MTRKWVELRVVYDDGSMDVWTPERLEKSKAVATDLIEMVLRSAKKRREKHDG